MLPNPLVINIVVFLIITLSIHASNSIRHRSFVRKSALVPQENSSWTYLYEHGDYLSFLHLTGFSRRSFNLLLGILFTDRTNIYPRKVGRPVEVPNATKPEFLVLGVCVAILGVLVLALAFAEVDFFPGVWLMLAVLVIDWIDDWSVVLVPSSSSSTISSSSSSSSSSSKAPTILELFFSRIFSWMAWHTLVRSLISPDLPVGIFCLLQRVFIQYVLTCSHVRHYVSPDSSL